MFKHATCMVTKHVNVKISGHEIGVHDVDFQKNPFYGSRDTPQTVLWFSHNQLLIAKKFTSFVKNHCGAPHVNLNLELWTVAQFSVFILSLASRQTEHIPRRLISSSFTIVLKLLVSNPTHSSRVSAVHLYNFPLSTFLLEYGLTIPFPKQCRYRRPRRFI